VYQCPGLLELGLENIEMSKIFWAYWVLEQVQFYLECWRMIEETKLKLVFVLHFQFKIIQMLQIRDVPRRVSLFGVPIWPHLVPKWPPIDFKSTTCIQNELTCLGKKQPTFDFQLTFEMMLLF